jgi:hypothetical protein
MSADLQITVTGELPQPAIELNPAAFEARRVTLAKAHAITGIESVTDLDSAAAALTEVASLTKSIEASRKKVKAPILDIGRHIDEVAKDYIAPLAQEKKRLETLIGAYQEAARRKAERERAEAAKAQADAIAEMQRKQAEALQAGDEAAADAARAEAANKIAEAQIAVINAEGPKAEGIVTRTTWEFEVTDIHALLAARPELCVISPNTTAIRAIIKATNGAAIPGIRCWQKAAAIVRNAPTVKVEDYDY